MKEILILIAGGYIGWWLALNKEQQTRKALTDTKIQLSNAKNEVVKKIKENDELKSVLYDVGIFRAEDKAKVSV